MKKYIGRLILRYLRWAAKLQLLKNNNATIIGITGSAGKTSTRLALVHILREQGKVKHSAHSNSESGIPLNILNIHPHSYSALDWCRMILLVPFKLLFTREKYDYYVVEMGIDSPLPPKNMSYLLTILVPHIAIVLNAGITHGAAFDYLVKDKNPTRRIAKITLEVAKEKMKLAHAVPTSGVVILNTDQKELKQLARGTSARLLTYGKKVNSSFKVIAVKQTENFTVEFIYQSQVYKLQVPGIFEDAYSSTFMAAIATAVSLGVTPQQSVQALKSFVPPKGRMRVFAGIRETRIIDSSYNASPDTMKSALTLLKKVAGRRHKVAILGDMRELGTQTKLSHKMLADWVRENADEAILFGEITKEFTLPVLVGAGFPVNHFSMMDDLTDYVREHLKEGSWILVKGSQNTILLERAVQAILADSKDVGNLARRGAYWDKMRSMAP